jgi:hypothetical protein
MNKISMFTLAILGVILLSISLYKEKGIDNVGNSSLIGRRGDTIRVYAKEPSHCKIKELVKFRNNWYLYGGNKIIGNFMFFYWGNY